jgi:anti-sigma regulatory factor (Ser/Thr protein kinase)
MVVVSSLKVSPAALELEPELTSVRRARHWLGDALSGQPDEPTDTAILLTSELVTNAILYAPGPVRVVLTLEQDVIRVEVHDSSVVEPLSKSYDAEALTGRGLDLLGALSDSWGVDLSDSGKAVWFQLGGQGPGNSEAHAPDASWVSDVQGIDGDDEGMINVVIRSLPMGIYIASEAHNDALMREFALISLDDQAPSLPRQLLDLVEEIQLYFGPQVSASRAQIAAARERGDSFVDLQIRMHPDNRAFVERVVVLLEEADRFCREGDLLTLAASDEVIRFRDWYLGQVLTQLDGAEPTPWPFA